MSPAWQRGWRPRTRPYRMCAADEEALAIAGESPVSGPDGSSLWPRRSEMLAGSSPPAFQMRVLPGLSSMRACSRSANVLQLTDSLRGRDTVNVVNVVKVSKNRLAFTQLLVDSSEGGVLGDGVKCRHDRVALLASNLV